MDLPTITMPRDEALAAFEDYSAAVRRRHQDEDAQVARGYQALAEGHALLDLQRALREGGMQEVTIRRRGWSSPRTMVLPRLAVCRATARTCQLELRWDGSAVFSADAMRRPRITQGVTPDCVVVPPDTFPHNDSSRSATAIVPLVPPGLRPARGLAGYHILWEAEWDVTAPLDPALLKHLGGNLWAVMAEWDLTELERAVLIGRARTA